MDTGGASGQCPGLTKQSILDEINSERQRPLQMELASGTVLDLVPGVFAADFDAEGILILWPKQGSDLSKIRRQFIVNIDTTVSLNYNAAA